MQCNDSKPIMNINKIENPRPPFANAFGRKRTPVPTNACKKKKI
jgi:hypothetical protein